MNVGHTYLQSGPASMNTTLPNNYSLCPGQCIDLNEYFTVYDAWGCDITYQANLRLDIISGNVTLDAQCSGLEPCGLPSPCLLPDVDDGDEYSHIHSNILIHPPQLTGIVLDLSFKPCENGSIFNSQKGCTHPGLYYTTCDTTENSHCSTYFYTDCTISCIYQLQSCGRCAADRYGVAFNYPNFICAKCEPHGWALFIFLQLVPLWIMMILLAVLHINITNGGLNGYILYSQLVSLQFPGLGYSSWSPSENTLWQFYFAAIPLIVYSIWNLNFLTLYPVPVCLPLVDTAASGVAGVKLMPGPV